MTPEQAKELLKKAVENYPSAEEVTVFGIKIDKDWEREDLLNVIRSLIEDAKRTRKLHEIFANRTIK